MGAPALINEAQLKQIKRLGLQLTFEISTHKDKRRARILKIKKPNKGAKHDLHKIKKINEYINKHKQATERQRKTFKHLCKVYGVKDNNSLDFILD